MNRTIDNFKAMATNIKKKLFKGENKENNNINLIYIYNNDKLNI